MALTTDFLFFLLWVLIFLIPAGLFFWLGWWIGRMRADLECCEEDFTNPGAFRRLENYLEEHESDEDGFTGMVLSAGTWRERGC